ncbi:M20 family metallopeptidase [Facklamia sp. DSM 111018]|uniref:Probable succinyl-diaminopimelate desuccinylase n=1 Tax=Facklamia lactis TaxID=2749967 RepID=A0ABS0LSZ0_9LACT|nr:M20 family metallopeptidase [Facklamia lactis]MBG9987277.1 M20 family metallopeptidase [Facklamia lactis]
MENKEALDLLVQSVNIDTTLGNEKQLANLLEQVFKKQGFRTKQIEYAEGRSGLIATIEGKESGPVLTYSGHLDVVPVGEVSWETDPFSATEIDGKLFGRGTCDMKGGLIALIAGVFRFLSKDTDFKGVIKFAITMGEETSSIGAQQLLELGEIDDIDAMIIAEPTSLSVGIAHKGALWPEITFYGQTAHGSMPHKGVNAIKQAIKAVEVIDSHFDFTKEQDEAVGHSTSSLNILQGGNGTNVVPDKCVVRYDIRTIASQEHEKIKQEFHDVLNRLAEDDETFNFEIKFINDLPAMKTSSDDPFVHLVVEAVKATTDYEGEINNPAYYTDASIFTQAEKNFPIIIIGPGIAEMAHQPNEFVEIDKFYDMISIVAYITEHYFK